MGGTEKVCKQVLVPAGAPSPIPALVPLDEAVGSAVPVSRRDEGVGVMEKSAVGEGLEEVVCVAEGARGEDEVVAIE